MSVIRLTIDLQGCDLWTQAGTFRTGQQQPGDLGSRSNRSMLSSMHSTDVLYIQKAFELSKSGFRDKSHRSAIFPQLLLTGIELTRPPCPKRTTKKPVSRNNADTGRVEWGEAREYGLLRRLKGNGDCFITEEADDDVCLRLDCIPV